MSQKTDPDCCGDCRYWQRSTTEGFTHYGECASSKRIERTYIQSSDDLLFREDFGCRFWRVRTEEGK